jgi:carbamoyl-phosphate synthase large subunit
MNVLITSCGHKTNLVKYFKKALIVEGGGQVYGADISNMHSSRHYVDRFLLSPDVNSTEFPSWIIDTITQHQINVIVPSRDGDLPVFAKLKKTIEDKTSCRVMVAEPQVIALCLDKKAFSEWCTANGFTVAKTFTKGQVIPSVLPLMIKPNVSSGSRGIIEIREWSDWLAVADSIDENYIIQSFVHAPEYTVDTYIDLHGNVVSVVPKKRLLVSHGESVEAEVDLDEQVIEQVSRLARLAKLQGHNTIQCFKQDEMVIVSEINARFGGGFTLGVEAGADTPRFVLRETAGNPLDFTQAGLSNLLKMTRIQKDVFYNRYGNGKVYCFDLDGTICTENCAYEDALPIDAVVEKINRLYSQGNTIIIATARGAASGHSWNELSTKQLARWGVQYHKLVDGKPFADFYIDNKAVDIFDFI